MKGNEGTGASTVTKLEHGYRIQNAYTLYCQSSSPGCVLYTVCAIVSFMLILDSQRFRKWS